MKTPHLHAEVLKEWLEDMNREVQVRNPDGTWTRSGFNTHPTFAALGKGLTYRLKPKTISIGSFEVPEPERKAPENGEGYWTLDSIGGVTGGHPWSDFSSDNRRLAVGRVWLNKADAETAAKAITELLGGTW